MTHQRVASTRRQFIQSGLGLAGLALITGCGVPTLPWRQPARIPRVAFLTSGVSPQNGVEAFRKGLGELGYVEGQTIVVEYRNTAGKAELIPDVTREMIGLQVDVLVVAPASAARDARQVTETVPIELPTAFDFAINLKTAQALGLTIPQSVLQQATELIQ